MRTTNIPDLLARAANVPGTSIPTFACYVAAGNGRTSGVYECSEILKECGLPSHGSFRRDEECRMFLDFASRYAAEKAQ